ncbi:hypothetical protein HY630_03630 [Candidatus Uhrbacteria bacterium]|nr:hypothetical protein [Candidatus Uhrbacteria bacterium]
MLRVVRKDETITSNDLLRQALDQITLGRPGRIGVYIFDEGEAEALYRALASRRFTQDQLKAWIERLRADHPYERKLVESAVGVWTWIRWVVFGGAKPQSKAITEPLDAWRKRAEAFVEEQIASMDEPAWLERPLQSLTVARHQIERETGKIQWTMPVMRWALVQLITSPPADTTSAHATG